MKTVLSLSAAFVLLVPQLGAWQPGTSQPRAAGGFVVNTADRTDVLAFFHTIYAASEGAVDRMNWTGNVTGGQAGSNSLAFQEDVRRRVNFFRAMAGLPADVVFNPQKAAKCQQAALMFSANGILSHNPPAVWLFYSAGGAEAAGASNIHLGRFGPEAIDDYIEDPGPNNKAVGHRRWIFYPEAREMATGDIPETAGKLSSNALWVVGDFAPLRPNGFVSWPNAGFVPRSLIPARWSLSHRNADFSQAVVTMKTGNVVVPLMVVSRAENGFGDNTIVWEPQGLGTDPDVDVSYEVQVSGIGGAGVPTSHSFTVRAFNPNVLGHLATISGPAVVPLDGAEFAFAPVPQADAYELRVGRVLEEAWTEGAEAAAGVRDGTTSSYSLLQSAVKRSGARGFQLTIPGFLNPVQWFEIDRELVPSAQTKLVFHHLFRWVHAESRLSVEVSTDDGDSWREVWGRNGKINSGSATDADWERSFQRVEVGLGAFAARPLRIRFVLRAGDFAFPGLSSYYGAFVDDISTTSAVEFIQTRSLPLPASESKFSLNAETAGTSWVPGAKIGLHIRPQVGTKSFEGNVHVVETEAPSGASSDFWIGQGQSVELVLPSDIFKMSGLPSGLRFDAATHTVRGRPLKPGIFTVVAATSGGERRYSFVVESIPPWSVGTFEAILAPPKPAGAGFGALGGHVTITSTSTGSFTGSLRLGARRVAFRGRLDHVAETLRGDRPLAASVEVPLDPRDPASGLLVRLEWLPDSASDNPGLSGSIRWGDQSLNIVAGWQRVWNAKSNPAFGGTSRVVNMAMENLENQGPRGTGFAVANVSASGMVGWKGTLADGTTFSASHALTPSGELPLYSVPRGSPGAVVLGVSETVSGARIQVVAGTDYRWVKTPTSSRAKDRVHPEGFDVGLHTSGAEYPGSGLFGNLPSGSDVVVNLTGAHLSTVPALSGMISADGAQLTAKWQPPRAVLLAVSGFSPRLQLSPGSGLLSGSVIIPGSVSRTLTIRALYIPDPVTPAASRLAGFHLLPMLPDAGEDARSTDIESGDFSIRTP